MKAIFDCPILSQHPIGDMFLISYPLCEAPESLVHLACFPNYALREFQVPPSPPRLLTVSHESIESQLCLSANMLVEPEAGCK